MAIELKTHQVSACRRMNRIERESKHGGFLCDDMGMGKTITMITHLKECPDRKNTLAHLIVCPVSLITHWVTELEKVDADAKINIYHGSAKKHVPGCTYVITTYSIVANNLKYFQSQRYDHMVLDESHMIKNVKTQRAVALIKIKGIARYRWCITGTPYNNDISDVWTQCHFIGTYPYESREKWRTIKNDPYRIKEWRNRMVIRRTKDDLLDDPVCTNHILKPHAEEAKLYECMRKQAADLFEQWRRERGYVKIKLQGHILSLLMKLRIFNCSYYCNQEITDSTEVIKNNAKVASIVKQAKEVLAQHDHLVIFSDFVQFLTVLETVFNDIPELDDVNIHTYHGTIPLAERDEVVKNFTTAEGKHILLITMKSGGTGLTLLPCSNVFIVNPWYNPFVEKQAQDRVHRIGQTNTVHVQRFMIENSVEHWMGMLKRNKSNYGNWMMGDTTQLEEIIAEDDLKELFKATTAFIKP